VAAAFPELEGEEIYRVEGGGVNHSLGKGITSDLPKAGQRDTGCLDPAVGGVRGLKIWQGYAERLVGGGSTGSEGGGPHNEGWYVEVWNHSGRSSGFKKKGGGEGEAG